MMVKVPAEIIADLGKIQKRFIGPSKSKIKRETIYPNLKDEAS